MPPEPPDETINIPDLDSRVIVLSRRSSGGLRLIDELVQQAGATGLPVTCRITGADNTASAAYTSACATVAERSKLDRLGTTPGRSASPDLLDACARSGSANGGQAVAVLPPPGDEAGSPTIILKSDVEAFTGTYGGAVVVDRFAMA